MTRLQVGVMLVAVTLIAWASGEEILDSNNSTGWRWSHAVIITVALAAAVWRLRRQLHR